MFIKIIFIGILTVILSTIIKQYRADLALLVNVCGGILIVLFSIESLGTILDSMINISSDIELSNDIIEPLIKVLAIGYITEFSADVAEDAGNKSMSSKILFGGKIAICIVAIPIIVNMLNAILSLL